MLPIVFLFFLLPFVEISILVRLSAHMGVANTLVSVFLASLVGAALARRAGIKALLAARAAFARGEMPAQELLDAAVVFASGVLLVVPGFVTGVAGLFLLLPISRRAIWRNLRQRLRHKAAASQTVIMVNGERVLLYGDAQASQKSQGPRRGQIIDAEFSDLSRS